MEFRFLHIADVHLDTPFYGREEELRHKLREATREAFRAGIDVAIERKAHAVLIAGDFFDNDILSFAGERFLLDSLRELESHGITVCYATGNHDPGRSNYRARQIGWTENLRLFCRASPETISITDSDGKQIAWVTGAGHTTTRESANLASGFDQPRSDYPHVAVLHALVTSARGSTEHDRYAPCSVDDLACRKFDYWALGHIHTCQQIENLPAWYPGNIQGRNPRETGIKGGLWVVSAKGKPPVVEFLPLSPVVWDHVSISCPPDVVEFHTLTQLLVQKANEQLSLDDGLEHLVRLDLYGQSAMARELNKEDNLLELTEHIQKALGLGWLEIRLRGLVQVVDLAEYKDSPTVLGKALMLIERMQSDDSLLDGLCPTHLAGEAEDRKLYLRELLEGMDRECAARLTAR